MKSYHTAAEIEREFEKHYSGYSDGNNRHFLWRVGVQELTKK
jgi:hypothetical protein